MDQELPGFSLFAGEPTGAAAPRKKPSVRQGSFEALGLDAQVCVRLAKRGYRFPTPVQRKVIPAVLAGGDVVAMARTGSGKTAAFLAPVISRLISGALEKRSKARSKGPGVIVLEPTRELAMQTFKFFKEYTPAGSAVKGVVIVGGEPLEAQFAGLSANPDVVVATPGRLLQVLSEMKAAGDYTLATVRVAIFDEADRLFEGGNGSQIAEECMAIVRAMGGDSLPDALARQTVLISATLPTALADFARLGLRENPQMIRLDVEKSLSPTLATGFLLMRREEKVAGLLTVLRNFRPAESSTSIIIFAATRHQVDFLVALLRKVSVSAIESPDQVVGVHGHMDQSGRNAAVGAFRSQEAKIMVVTDLAARGIDIPVLDLVIHFDFPPTPKLFVHRSGRVARAGRFGTVIALINTEEVPYALDTFLFLGRPFSPSLAATKTPAPSTTVQWMDQSYLVGRLLDSEVEIEMESVKSIVQSHSDIQSQWKSASNADKLYRRTRAKPSGESVRRSKELVATGVEGFSIHPWFAEGKEATENARMKATRDLKSWRPKQTLLTSGVGMEHHKSRVLEKAATAQDETDENVAPKFHSVPMLNSSENVLQKEKRKSVRQLAMEEQKSKFYVKLAPDDIASGREQAMSISKGGSMAKDRLNDLIMDMNGEETTKRGSRLTWDRKKKKYVTNDAGQKQKADERGDGEQYSKWRKRTRGQDFEQRNDLHGLGKSDFRTGKRGRFQSLRDNAAPRASKSELRDVDAIRKQRVEKEKNKDRHSKKPRSRQKPELKVQPKTGLRKGQAFTRSKVLVRKTKSR